MTKQLIIAFTCDGDKAAFTVTGRDSDEPRTYEMRDVDEIETVREWLEETVDFVHQNAMRDAMHEANASLLLRRIDGFFENLSVLRSGGVS